MRIGAALDNCDQPPPESLRRLTLLSADVVGTLWTAHPRDGGGTCHRRAVYDELERQLDAPAYHLRVGPSARIAPRAWRDQALRALDELPPAARVRVRVRLLNEPNLPAEGAWAPREYAAWAIEAAGLLRASAPDVRTIAAPPSLGPLDWQAWWDALLDAWDDAGGVPTDGLAVNAYAHLVDWTDLVLADASLRGKQAHVTEINTLAVPPGPARAAWLVDRLCVLASKPYASAEIFIVGGQSYGAWDERYVLRDDEAEAIGRWRRSIPASSPPVEAPAHPTTPATSGRKTMHGRGFWIWYAPKLGSPDDLISRARELRLTHLVVKGGDGDDFWPQLTANDLVRRVKDAGIDLYAWQYCYGRDPVAEADVARRILDAGVDGIVADVEQEYEGSWRAAETYAGTVRRHAGDRLFAYSPLPVVDLHTALPYLQFNQLCDLVLPQFYSRALGQAAWPLDRLYDIWGRWQATWAAWGVPAPPIAPIGEAFGTATADDVRAFEHTALARGVTAWSFWELGQATPEQLAVLAEPPPSGPVLLPDESRRVVTAALDGIWNRTERLASLEHVQTAVDIQQHVVALKRALGLQGEVA